MALNRDTSNKLISDLMRRYDISQNAAIGFVGALAMESGGFGNLQEDKPLKGGRGGYGYAQWTGARRTAFEDYAAKNGLKPSSYEAQRGYLFRELDGHGKYDGGIIERLKKSKTVEAAMITTTNRYLRPSADSVNWAARRSWTNDVKKNYVPIPGEDVFMPQVATELNTKEGKKQKSVNTGAPAFDIYDRALHLPSGKENPVGSMFPSAASQQKTGVAAANGVALDLGLAGILTGQKMQAPTPETMSPNTRSAGKAPTPAIESASLASKRSGIGDLVQLVSPTIKSKDVSEYPTVVGENVDQRPYDPNKQPTTPKFDPLVEFLTGGVYTDAAMRGTDDATHRSGHLAADISLAPLSTQSFEHQMMQEVMGRQKVVDTQSTLRPLPAPAPLAVPQILLAQQQDVETKAKQARAPIPEPADFAMAARTKAQFDKSSFGNGNGKSPTKTALLSQDTIADPVLSFASLASGGSAAGNNASSAIEAQTSSARTIQGSATGRSYNVDQIYSNANGSYRAMADGTFERVSSSSSNSKK